mmetsp:Transcript_31676/g.51234  ORF Transcript_31676/g.51234 Transcript_31676/m.51234 type:complete len:98 (+) Transcript_31676:1050-1343(+)
MAPATASDTHSNPTSKYPPLINFRCGFEIGVRRFCGMRLRNDVPMATRDPHVIAKNRRIGTPSSPPLELFTGHDEDPFSGANENAIEPMVKVNKAAA